MTDGSSTRRLDWILSPESHPDPQGPGAGLTVGVLALQGDFREHRAVLEGLGAATREVRRADQLVGLDGLVVPGGESTTMSKLIEAYGLAGPIADFHAGGGALYGTCAGLIVLATGTVEGFPPTLGLIDVVARRNAFGRQVRSFEADLQVQAVGPEPVRAVFIRAPWIESAGPGVEVLACCEGHAVAARQGRVLITAFHPELTDDTRLHELFIEMLRRGDAAPKPERAAQPRAAGEPGRAVPAPVNC
jgi:pyridoxal 5'-phosphate synthase pdxT subunit